MANRLRELLPWLHYPVVVTTTFALFAWLRAQGVSLVVSTYVPVLLAAGLVTLLELRFPHRSAWRPPLSEIKTDLTVHDGRAARVSRRSWGSCSRTRSSGPPAR